VKEEKDKKNTKDTAMLKKTTFETFRSISPEFILNYFVKVPVYGRTLSFSKDGGLFPGIGSKYTTTKNFAVADLVNPTPTKLLESHIR